MANEDRLQIDNPTPKRLDPAVPPAALPSPASGAPVAARQASDTLSKSGGSMLPLSALIAAIFSWQTVAVIVITLIYMSSGGAVNNLSRLLDAAQSVKASANTGGLTLELSARDSVKAVGRQQAKAQNALLTPDQYSQFFTFAQAAAVELNAALFNPQARLRVLWVDDHPENNVDLQYAFQVLGIIVICIDSNQTIQQAFYSASGFDVVISDMGRDNVGNFRSAEPEAGLKTIEILNRDYYGVPVVIFSSGYAAVHEKEKPTYPVALISRAPQEIYHYIVELARNKAKRYAS